jgi:hypothetical protein
MNKKEFSQEQSNIRNILIQAELALKENRFDEALATLSRIEMNELANLPIEELYAIGNLINYIKNLAEEKKDDLVSQMKIIQASKEYL